jgi:hypothetical protein
MAKDERPLPALFIEFADEMTLLIRQEADLIKVEISEKFSHLGLGLASVMIGGLLASSGLLVLLASAVLALAHLVPTWLAALIVGLIISLAGSAFLLSGRNALKPKNMALRRTAHTFNMEKELVKEQLHSDRKG